MMRFMNTTHELIDKLLSLVKTLRNAHKGDPWIIAQNFKSLAPLTIEEAYEFADSVDNKDFTAMADELGDLILHVFLYAELSSEQNQFDINTIIQNTLDKQQRRKLNYNNPSDISAEAALKLWEQKKAAEKQTDSVLDHITKKLPALLRAEKLQSQAASVGFDWPDAAPIYEKIAEEISEFKAAVTSKDTQHMEDELGDILFSVVNLARHYKINPESALRHANQKFEKRFRKLENKIENNFENYSLEQLDQLWNTIKKL
jgi:ATP diphosphatase